VSETRQTIAQPRPAGADAPHRTRNTLARLLGLGRPVVMGVLNVTPDSFSDGGRFLDPQHAIAHARRMAAQGADILDIGAESTRPYGGAVPVSHEEEMRRLEPVLPAVTSLGVPVSIDTMKASVAAAALAAGPAIDIMADIAAFFSRSLDIAARAGIARENIVLDPGIGFGKTPQQSITAIARLSELKSFGLPLLVGASRKRFIDSVSPAPPEERIGGSIASHLLAVENGAAIVRAHDVAETVQALRVAAAIRDAR
jgi:dihydropteroate synthase